MALRCRLDADCREGPYIPLMSDNPHDDAIHVPGARCFLALTALRKAKAVTIGAFGPRRSRDLHAPPAA
ncbi:hypothetical protein D3C71_683040 [compost metagenome]